jgi:coiled-coil domain-containing protein 55
MNVALLSAADRQKKKAKLSHGLNPPSSSNHNVFGGDDDEDDEEGSGDGRTKVNQELQRQQDFLRQRAPAALYDFDGTYKERESEQKAKVDTSKPKESRYMTDMLKAAKRRNFARDIAYERKLAREQEAEESEYAGKEKFITSAYRKKLEERQLWLKEEEEERKREETEDVTKQEAGIAAFYSNFRHNVSVGGEAKEETKTPGFLEGFEPATASIDKASGGRGDGEQDGERDSLRFQSSAKPSFIDGFEAAEGSISIGEEKEGCSDTPTNNLRELRDEKIAQARARYFARRRITEEEAVKERL